MTMNEDQNNFNKKLAVNNNGNWYEQQPMSFIPAALSPKDLYYERILGYVQRFAHNSGWGFVRSTVFEGDLFFHIDNLMSPFKDQKLHRLSTGQVVEFTIVPDDQDRPHAVFLKPIVHQTPFGLIGTRCCGFIRRFEKRRGYINSPAFDGDLVAPRKNLLPPMSSLSFGQPVEFDIALDDQNRCVAKWIATKFPSEPQDWFCQGRISGHIKSFQDRWGFINSDKFQGDLFVHRDSIRPECRPGGNNNVRLVVGTPVEFEVGVDDISRGGRLLGIKVVVFDNDGFEDNSLHNPLYDMPQDSYQKSGNLPQPLMDISPMCHVMPSIYPPFDATGNLDTKENNGNSTTFFSHFPTESSTPLARDRNNIMYSPTSHGHNNRTSNTMREDNPTGGAPPRAGKQGGGKAPATMPPDDVVHILYVVTDSWEPESIPTPHEQDNPQSPTCYPALPNNEYVNSFTLTISRGELLMMIHETNKGWAYVAKWKPGEASGTSRGWVPSNLLSEVNVRRVRNDWDDIEKDANRPTMDLHWGEWISTDANPIKAGGWVFGNKVDEHGLNLDAGAWIPEAMIKAN